MPRPPSLAALLKDLDADELREVVTQLCKLAPQNRTFVELYLRGSDDVDTGALLDALSAKLRACFLARTGSPKRRADLAEARRLVVEHERLAADYPAVAAEGALRYAEVAFAYAAALRERHRFVPQAALDAAVRMVDRLARAVAERPRLAERFAERAEALLPLDRRRLFPLVQAIREGRAPDAPAPEADGYAVEYDRAPRPPADDDWG